MKTTEKILWLLAILGFLAGLVGLYTRFTGGHQVASYNTFVPWGLWIAVYVTLIGISAGGFLIASLAYGFGVKALQPVGRISLLIALGTLIGGMSVVVLDLGHPERIFSLLFSSNASSVMGWMGWLYLLFGILLVVMLYLAWKSPQSSALHWLGWIGLPFAVVFGAAEGSLFGVVGARALWESGLTPILFLAEGAFAGAATVLMLSALLGEREALPFLRKLTLGLLFAVLLLETSEYFTAFYANMPAKVAALQLVFSGPNSWVFWIAHLALGLLLPLVLLASTRNNPALLAAGGALAALLSVTAKLNLLIPAFTVPEFEALQTAYVGPDLTLAYFPTTTEWLVSLWAASLAAILFLVGYRLLFAPGGAKRQSPDAQRPAQAQPAGPA